MLEFLAAALGLTVLLLAVPVDVVYALRKDEAWRGRVVLYWMFGLVRVRSRPGRRKPARPTRRRRKRRLLASGTRAAVRRRRDLFAVLRTRGLLPRLVRLLRDLLRATRPRRLRLELVIGLEDPADTGRLAGLLAPLRLLFGRRRFGAASNVSIEVTPDFAGPRFQGYSCASLHIVPLELLALFVGFLFSAPVFAALRTLRQRSRR